jgi:DNA-directed RNA polymerase specialized sigma24 family protein
MNNTNDFANEFTQEFFMKILPTLDGSWTPDPKVHYGNYFYTIIRNTLTNWVTKEERYSFDLFQIKDEPTETFQTEVSMDSKILRKYQTALLGECYAIVDEADVDLMLKFLTTHGKEG